METQRRNAALRHPVREWNFVQNGRLGYSAHAAAAQGTRQELGLTRFREIQPEFRSPDLTDRSLLFFFYYYYLTFNHSAQHGTEVEVAENYTPRQIELHAKERARQRRTPSEVYDAVRGPQTDAPTQRETRCRNFNAEQSHPTAPQARNSFHPQKAAVKRSGGKGAFDASVKTRTRRRVTTASSSSFSSSSQRCLSLR